MKRRAALEGMVVQYHGVIALISWDRVFIGW